MCKALKIICFILIFLFSDGRISAQNYEAKSVGYNVLLGGVSGGIGALINKRHDQKWYNALKIGFLTGCGGGLIAYTGKKTNALVAQKHELGYAWMSRAIFSAGNSIIENAASNIPFWSRWHYDIGFIRCEYRVKGHSFIPRIMPSSLGGTIFLFLNGDLDPIRTLQSGTLTFKTPVIKYAPNFVASTPGNGVLYSTALTGKLFYETYAHEMIHVFQFQEYSGCNYFFNPLSEQWRSKNHAYNKACQWIYFDLNYEVMLGNYFFVQGGHKTNYRHNFLENEAEFLSVGRPAIP